MFSRLPEVAFRDLQNFIDIAAVLPLILRIENNFEFPSLEQKPASHYVLVGDLSAVQDVRNVYMGIGGLLDVT